MSPLIVSRLAFAAQQVVIYGGSFLFLAGIIGGPLTLTTFLSLRTSRENSCVFYLTCMTVVNIVNLFFSLLTFIMTTGFGINWLNLSRIFCKFRPFYLQLGNIMSLVCICLATIDQFLATCSHPRWHQWNKIKGARHMVGGAVVLCLLRGIPFLLYYDLNLLAISGNFICSFTITYL